MRFSRPIHCLLLGSLSASAFARAAPLAGLGDKESLTYKVAWAILPGIGEITVNAHATSGAGATALLSVVTHTETRGIARLLLPFEAKAESLFDPPTGRLLALEESSAMRSKTDSHTVTFSYADETATYSDGAHPAEKRILPMPEGLPTDLITCLVQARTWGLRPGETHDALVLFEDDFYVVTVHATGFEVVPTPMGTYMTVVLEPRMDKSPPKGMFKRGSKVKVWISQDSRHLPVQFKVDFKVGSGVATLVAYHPPVASAPLAPRS
ncbi:MAG: DUF3108 domain-containing protein [Opitutaceae bacterium]